MTEEQVNVELHHCRKCMRNLPAKEFYESVDAGFIDTNKLMSVCKDCIQKLYDNIFEENQSMEKALHKLCVALNMRFSNDAVSATKAHINTLLESGKKVNAVFGIYKQKLISTKKSMSKSGVEDMSYEDVGTIFTSETINTKEIPIPPEVIIFWGKDIDRKDIEFLEEEFKNFKSTHKAETHAEVTLLKQVCYTLLNIKKLRANNDDTGKLVKELQELMKNLAISPNVTNAAGGGRENEAFGLWIRDIETEEPAQWLLTDPRGNMYRDVGNIEEYFQKYMVRPLKNFIQGSKDFNIGDDTASEDEDLTLTPEEAAKYDGIDDGETDDG
jgi:hypothetical protein